MFRFIGDKYEEAAKVLTERHCEVAKLYATLAGIHISSDVGMSYAVSAPCGSYPLVICYNTPMPSETEELKVLEGFDIPDVGLMLYRRNDKAQLFVYAPVSASELDKRNVYDVIFNAMVVALYRCIPTELQIPKWMQPEELMVATDDKFAEAKEFVQGKEAEIAEAKRKAEIARRQKEWRDIENYCESDKAIKKVDAALSKVDFSFNVSSAISDLKRRIEENMERLNEYRRKIESTISQLADQNAQIKAMLFGHNDVDSRQVIEAIKRYIGKNKTIKTVSVDDDDTLRLYCQSVVEYWEDDEIQQWLNKDDYRSSIIKLVTSGTLKLITYCRVTLSLSNNTVRGDDTVPSSTRYECFLTDYPHPHVGRYGCFGNNQEVIQGALSKRDFDTALSTVNIAICQINLTDGCVVDTMCEYLCSNQRIRAFCEVGEDGEYIYYTVREAVARALVLGVLTKEEADRIEEY